MKTKTQPIVLLVEDDIMTAECYKGYLENEPINLVHVDTGDAALLYLQQETPAAFLLDLGLPDMNGMDVLKLVYEQKLKCAVIVITAKNAVDVVVEAMHYGAFDFIEKPCKHNRLVVTLHNALHQHRLSQKVEFDEESCKCQQYHEFIGVSKPMQTVYQAIDNVATSKASILITGENGTGKELCAEAIHKESKRAAKFIVFDCAAVSKDLMESQLFGHVKGAFTNAINNRLGAALQAEGGTLFLDEIGEIPLDLQSTLLRFMQTRTFRKVGSDKLERVDIRLIFATNRDLLAEVKVRRFREDLYHRINTIDIELPALRQRGQDILLLAKFFLHKFAKEEQKDFQGFNAEAERILLGYKWPGNVRELQNTIHNVVLLDKGKVITAEMLAAKIGKKVVPNKCNSLNDKDNLSEPQIALTSDKIIRPYKEIEKEVIVKTIEYCDGNVVEAAKLLKIGKTTLYRKQQKWKSIK
jgi:two-component system repressor protein LuxO